MKRALLLVLLAGCASDRGISHRSTLAEPVALQAEKSLGAQSATGEWPALDWWKRFGDPQLDTLVDGALAGSPNMRLAQARLEQARAQASIARMPLRPRRSPRASRSRRAWGACTCSLRAPTTSSISRGARWRIASACRASPPTACAPASILAWS